MPSTWFSNIESMESYSFLEDENDVMFRKVDKTDSNFIIPLDNEEEVIKVAKAFNDKQ